MKAYKWLLIRRDQPKPEWLKKRQFNRIIISPEAVRVFGPSELGWKYPHLVEVECERRLRDD